MNNPLQILGAIRNPEQFIQQAMNSSQIMQNPLAKNALEMYQRGDKQGVNELASNLCKEKGTTYEEMVKQIKSNFGM